MATSKAKTKLHSWFHSIRRVLYRLTSSDYTAVNTMEPPNSGLRKIHMSKAMVDDFVNIARPNTKEKLHTGAAMCGKLVNGEFYVTALYIPMQTCETHTYEVFREVRVLNYCNKYSLIHIGSIHLHPRQRCYLTSIELHNHFWHQITLPEAISVVVAPTDYLKKYGVFRMTDQGISVIKDCKKKRTSLHRHKLLKNEGPIYHDCSNNIVLDSEIQYSIEDMHFDPRRN